MVSTRQLGPGLAVAAAAGAVALAAHAVVAALSPTLVAIALGIALAASGRVDQRLRPGLGLASRRVLRVGVALLGLQLALPQIVALGWPVLLVVAGVVGLGITLTLALARRLGVPGDTALLIACGFSICGAAAVVAVDGVRRPRAAGPDGAAAVVSLVVVFGSVAMLLIPALAGLAGLDQVAAGAWSGASIHEVGQVVVAGGILGAAAVPVAVAVKLARVLLLAPVLTILSVRSRRADVVRPPLVPGFVAAFLGCVVARTVLPLPAVLLDVAALVQSGALATAMFALGCALDPGALRRTGAPVLLLAAGATGIVALLGLPAAWVAG
ncbi:YeiH family protein [Nocardioides sp.]|uniref:YeiH family protein n=1 Tax=Nocardioides sp. TaxID=35761 RepID=UPI002EDABB3E